ncbi:MAG: D-glycero-beta-D-manno-heptose 1,7-bisphosphate 7-phosphatase [Bacteroidales bacterium]|jgi:D,D-heptose 1,7-bisphosphate phosphatase|nr:D-glycero-beta-D-manno-heptose 1,7-bisphosphate 7-phosphatase [Bacteroidales bacterium]
MMEAIILAGGMGTRLREVVADVPKPMAIVGGKPFLWHILGWLAKSGCSRIIISSGYKSETISGYIGNSFRDIPVEYVVEEQPLGTGGAVKFSLGRTVAEEVLIVNGDTWFPVDLGEFMSFHRNAKSPFTIALKRMKDFSRYGSVDCSGNRIVRFNEKKFCSDGFINGGIYLMNRHFLDQFSLPDVFSLEKDILEKAAGEGILRCLEFSEPFIDIGIPDDYRKAQTMFRKKALFIDRDGVINVDKVHVYRKEDFEFNEGIFDLCRKYIEEGFLIIVITNQAGIAKGLYSEKDFDILTRWMLEQFSGKGIEISGVYHCPHHPDVTGRCQCRKPEPGMILRAARDFDLDISECQLIGDKETDLEAGRRAGIPEGNLKLYRTWHT